MLVNYVWPFREVPGSTERKTFFWLECSYEEAVEVLHQVKLSARDFENYVNHLYKFRAEGLGDQELDEGLSVYKRIGFLISEDGKSVEWAPPGFPISNQWNAYNPFQTISVLRMDSFKDFVRLASDFAHQNVALSSELVLPAEFGHVCPTPEIKSEIATDEWAIEPGDEQATDTQ